jgi:hypothetical protein
MKRTRLLFTIFCLLPTSWNCGNSNGQLTNLPFHLDLDNCKVSINLKLSDLIDSCRFIQLETTSKSIIDNNINLLYIAKKQILIGDRNGVYKFSGDGKFIKKLINTGRGPNEISEACVFHYYEAKNLLLIENRLGSKDNILCYDIQSERFLTPIKKCFPVNWSDFIVYQDSLLMGSIEIGGYLPQDPIPNPYALFIQNFKGEFISGIKSTKRLVHENYKELFQRMSIHTGDKNVYLKNSHDDTIFYFNNNKVSPYIIPVFKNGSDIPKMIPDVGTKHVRLEKYANKSFMIFNLSEFGGWKNENGFSRAAYSYNFYLLNKSNGKYGQIRSYTDDLLGKVTDIDNSMKNIPGVINSLPNGKLYVLYFPHELSKLINQKSGAFPEKLFTEFTMIKKNIIETDNPIILIGNPQKRLQILN